jgi:hypothetical protein
MSSALPAPGSAVKWPPNELRLILTRLDNPQVLERHIQQILIHLDLRKQAPLRIHRHPVEQRRPRPGPNDHLMNSIMLIMGTVRPIVNPVWLIAPAGNCS